MSEIVKLEENILKSISAEALLRISNLEKNLHFTTTFHFYRKLSFAVLYIIRTHYTKRSKKSSRLACKHTESFMG